MMKKTILAITLVALSACAQAPDKIAAATLPDSTYMGLSCSAASVSLANAEANLAQLEEAQRKTARNDTIGVILLGVPTASMTGNDHSAEIAVLKGQIDALRIRAAGC